MCFKGVLKSFKCHRSSRASGYSSQQRWGWGWGTLQLKGQPPDLTDSGHLVPSYDIGSTNTSAEGVNIHTVLELSKDEAGRLKISNVSCKASIARMYAGFSGTLRYPLGTTYLAP